MRATFKAALAAIAMFTATTASADDYVGANGDSLVFETDSNSAVWTTDGVSIDVKFDAIDNPAACWTAKDPAGAVVNIFCSTASDGVEPIFFSKGEMHKAG